MPQFSDFDGCRFDDDEEDARCMNQMIDFISGEYLNVLEIGQHHVIYYHDARLPNPTAISGDVEQDEVPYIANEVEWTSARTIDLDSHTESKEVVWRDVAQNSDMCGFDEISALSQFSINRQFRAAWSEQQSTIGMGADKMLVRWGYQDRFEATFEPLTIRLRNDGRATIFINLTEGFLKPLVNSLPNAE